MIIIFFKKMCEVIIGGVVPFKKMCEMMVGVAIPFKKMCKIYFAWVRIQLSRLELIKGFYEERHKGGFVNNYKEENF